MSGWAAILCLAVLRGAAPPAPSLTAMPGAIVEDVRHLSGREPLITLAIGGVLAAVAHPSDARVVSSISGNHRVEEALDAGAVAGNGFVQVGGAAAIYGAGEWLRRPELASLGAELLQAHAVAGLLTEGLKVAVARRRPDGGRYGFPSGHSAISFATAGVVTRHFGWRYGVAAYAGATYVALSRLADRQHFTSDVVFGSAIGLAASRTVPLVSRRNRWSIGANAVRGTGVVTLTYRRGSAEN
jgi:membrane-associated phospholipid phosphatase